MALSVLVALILTPALCATMLKPIAKGDHGEGKKGFFGWFNRMFEKSTHHYTDSEAVFCAVRGVTWCCI
ncbi:acriflavin resistance protein B [Escherichia coli]|uniref:Acriflavin resistance protein B n=1 Tax=Escherichia coli TaxID=562 RepID=A0A377AZW8_ECOLX|nr:acriflavin resistance protein B [Escherichia coli]